MSPLPGIGPGPAVHFAGAFMDVLERALPLTPPPALAQTRDPLPKPEPMPGAYDRSRVGPLACWTTPTARARMALLIRDYGREEPTLRHAGGITALLAALPLDTGRDPRRP
jgi:hypothetical protein